MAVCGQQVVDHLPENNPMQWFRPSGTPTLRRVQHKDGAWDRLSPAEKKADGGWDDVNAMYRGKPFSTTVPRNELLRRQDLARRSHAERPCRVYNYCRPGLPLPLTKTRTSCTAGPSPGCTSTTGRSGHLPQPWKASLRTVGAGSNGLFFKSRPQQSRTQCGGVPQQTEAALESGTRAFLDISTGEKALGHLPRELCGKPPSLQAIMSDTHQVSILTTIYNRSLLLRCIEASSNRSFLTTSTSSWMTARTTLSLKCAKGCRPRLRINVHVNEKEPRRLPQPKQARSLARVTTSSTSTPTTCLGAGF